MEKEEKIIITVENELPIDLVDFTNMFLGTAAQYRRFLERNHGSTVARDMRLYVKEVRQGSIIAELMAVLPLVLNFANTFNTVTDFLKYLHTTYKALQTSETAALAQLQENDYEQLSQIVEPIAKDGHSHITISNVENLYVVSLNSTESNAVQNTANRQLQALKDNKQAQSDFPQVVMYWYQARSDSGSPVGDKAIIESISDKPVKVFADESLKRLMILGDENPFRYAYLVDVNVQTVNQKPALYKILHIHDKFEKPEDS
jgi:hypothetical protein